MIVRRRSEPVEAVQWHKPGDHPREIVFDDGTVQVWGGAVVYRDVHPADWIIPADDGGYRVLTPEQFEAEYERVEA